MVSQENKISDFVKFRRAGLRLTQQELAAKAGVGLRFIRDLEQGKQSLRLDKVNQVLQLFGYSLSPTSERALDPFYIHRHHFNKHVRIDMKNKTTLIGFIVGDVVRDHQIIGWKMVSNRNAKAYKRTKDEALTRRIDHSEIESIQNIDE